MQLFKLYANGKLHYYRERLETFEQITATDFTKAIADGYRLTGFAQEYGGRLLIYVYTKKDK